MVFDFNLIMSRTVAPPAVLRVANPNYTGNSCNDGFGWLNINYEFSTRSVAVYGFGVEYRTSHRAFQAAWSRRSPNVDYASGTIAKSHDGHTYLIMSIVSYNGMDRRRRLRVFAYSYHHMNVKNFSVRDLVPVGNPELRDIKTHLGALSCALAEWKSGGQSNDDLKTDIESDSEFPGICERTIT